MQWVLFYFSFYCNQRLSSFDMNYYFFLLPIMQNWLIERENNNKKKTFGAYLQETATDCCTEPERVKSKSYDLI